MNWLSNFTPPGHDLPVSSQDGGSLFIRAMNARFKQCLRTQHLTFRTVVILAAATVSTSPLVRADPATNSFANGIAVVPLLRGALIPAAPRPLTVIGVGGY